ncbi:hypothetical protein LIER_42271 [Lithospermum erythrorhizon]|uniref:Ureide permease 1-like n=1 Tax=Lithospermum erythrorhizon TaxID=34254 RepID=A0AAV3RQH4_LITER
MFELESKGGGIACVLLALLLTGTWPAILTLLERRGRLPQHTYLDFTITNLLAALIMVFAFGEAGKNSNENPNFLNQLPQDNWSSVSFALAAGVFLSLGNISIQYAFALVGLAVTLVISLSISIVIGTTLNFFLDDQINKAQILFPGVGCFVIAVFVGFAVHTSNSADDRDKLLNRSNDFKEAKGANLESGTTGTVKAKFGTADFLVELEEKRAIKVFGRSNFVGFSITIFAGICFSLFSPSFNLATNDQFHTLKGSVPNLSVCTAYFHFSISSFVVAIFLNVMFLYRPAMGSSSSSLGAYISDWKGRGWALVAGTLCGLGNGSQFIGGQAAGYAAAAAAQALPLVSTFWGIILFGEYWKSSRRTYSLLGSMLFMFALAVALLMASSAHRN